MRFLLRSTFLLLALASVSFAATSGDWTYSVSNNVATINLYSGAGGSVVIPGVIDGFTVTRIWRGGQKSSIFAQSPASIADVTIPNSVTNIGSFAFQSCTSLTGLAIPSSVVSIENFAFDGCSALTSLNVAAANLYYSSEDGVLFNKAKTKLVRFLGGKGGAYSVPSSVTNVADYAFYYSLLLTSVSIPSGVTSIGNSAFYGCTGLLSIVFLGTPPSSLPTSLSRLLAVSSG